MPRYPCGSCLAELNDSGSASCESSCTAAGAGPRAGSKFLSSIMTRSCSGGREILEQVKESGEGKEDWEQLLGFS